MLLSLRTLQYVGWLSCEACEGTKQRCGTLLVLLVGLLHTLFKYARIAKRFIQFLVFPEALRRSVSPIQPDLGVMGTLILWPRPALAGALWLQTPLPGSRPSLLHIMQTLLAHGHRGPKAGRALFFGESERGEEADLVFGGVTVVTGGASSTRVCEC